jgi:hypothetical protein
MTAKLAARVLPSLDQRSQQQLRARCGLRAPAARAQMPVNGPFATSSSDMSLEVPQASLSKMDVTASLPPMTSNANTHSLTAAGQPRNASAPYLPPPPICPPTVAAPQAAGQPAPPFLPPPVRPLTYGMAPSSGPSAAPFGQQLASPQSYCQPSTSAYQASTSSFNARQGTSQTLNGSYGLPPRPQPSRPQQDSLRPPSLQPLPASHFPPLSGTLGMVALAPTPSQWSNASAASQAPRLQGSNALSPSQQVHASASSYLTGAPSLADPYGLGSPMTLRYST